MEEFIALEYAERNEIAPDGRGLGEAYLRVSAEFFDILGSACQGDVLEITRGLEGCRGVSVWSKLNQEYSPKAMVGQISFEPVLAAWWDKSRRLGAVFGERLPHTGQVACVAVMLPARAQE